MNDIKETFNVKITRKEFLSLPMEARRRILAEQVVQMHDLYKPPKEVLKFLDDNIDQEDDESLLLLADKLNASFEAQDCIKNSEDAELLSTLAVYSHFTEYLVKHDEEIATLARLYYCPKGDEEGFLKVEEIKRLLEHHFGKDKKLVTGDIAEVIFLIRGYQKRLDDINKEKEIEEIFDEIETNWHAYDIDGLKHLKSKMGTVKPLVKDEKD